jgi:hypothetical protein
VKKAVPIIGNVLFSKAVSFFDGLEEGEGEGVDGFPGGLSARHFDVEEDGFYGRWMSKRVCFEEGLFMRGRKLLVRVKNIQRKVK